MQYFFYMIFLKLNYNKNVEKIEIKYLQYNTNKIDIDPVSEDLF